MSTHLPGHPAELSDSVKLLLSDAKRYGFEIDQVLKSIDWHFLYQNFNYFGQVVCLLHKFERTQVFYYFTDYPSEIQNSACIPFHFFYYSCHREKINLKWKINWQTYWNTWISSLIQACFRLITKKTKKLMGVLTCTIPGKSAQSWNKSFTFQSMLKTNDLTKMTEIFIQKMSIYTL